MYSDDEKVVLCGASAYEQKYYFNQDFASLPQSVQDELHIMCVMFTVEIGGIFTMWFDSDGSLQFETEAVDADAMYDEIGGALRIKQYQEEKKDLLESLELYYRVFFLGEEVPEEAFAEEDGEKPESKKRTLQTMSPLKIGNVEMQNPLVLAPMAGVTDLPFRVLCKEQGAGLICMEMVSAKAILYKNKNTEDLMTIHPGEHPVSLQLFGSDPEILAQIAAQIEERPFDILDFNMGCPVPKVVNNGEGSALMKDPALVRKIVTGMVKAVKKPVTVKIRKGFNEESANAVEIAKILEDCGVAAIAVHGRTRAQFYSGKADWDIIRQVKEAVSIPVIGNGDVVDAASAEALVEQTGCDGIMIGRGAEGNPWIFKQILHYRETGETLAKPTQHEVKEMMLRHARMQVEYKGGAIGIREMRKHVAWYTAGFPHSAKLRAAINQVESLQELEQMLNEWERG